jgi:hypothetical protein
MNPSSSSGAFRFSIFDFLSSPHPSTPLTSLKCGGLPPLLQPQVRPQSSVSFRLP